MHRRIITLCLLMALALPAGAAVPVWPLDLETRYLTSNFMERRPGRWHAGLDLKTQTVTGFPVHAAEDGWISRVRAEPGAYGRVVYLVGDSGKTYVYAHLERFADVLQEVVDADRDRHGRYRVRRSLARDALRVKAGQVLGLTGQSGTGGPHLHFEVRDGSQRPLNPLDHGFAVPDTFAPLIKAVTAHAVRPPLAGGAVARRTEAADGLSGDLPPLVLSGPVAFSADISDRSDIRGHVLEPDLITATLDGRPVYRCRNEAFAFADNNQQRLEWCGMDDADGRGVIREHWLHRRAEVDLPGRSGGAWYLGAGEGLSPGTHMLEITASDRAGNATSVRVSLQVEPAAGATCRLAGWGDADPALRPAPGVVLTPFFSLHAQADPAVRKLDPVRGDPVLARTVLWRGPAPRPEGALWSGLFLAADWPLDGDLRVEAPVDSNSRADGAVWIFRRGRRSWQPVGPLHGQGADAWFALAEPGTHAAFRDDRPPVMATATLAVGQRVGQPVPGVTLPRWSTVAVTVEDGEPGSGVDAASIVVRLDGEPLIVEPDLIRHRILVTVPDGTAPGAHVLTVEAADRAGNRGGATMDLVCSAGES